MNMKDRNEKSRRSFLRESSMLVASGLVLGPGVNLFAADSRPDGFRPIFDGKTLTGWTAKSRAGSPGPGKGGKGGKGGPSGKQPANPSNEKAAAMGAFYQEALKRVGKWRVQEGAIIGEQDPPASGLGGYLVSDADFGDFELLIDAKPDWPADTGVLVRTIPAGNVGYQILIDHRPSGGIGGFYGNGLAGFHAVNFNVAGVFDAGGKCIGLKEEDPKDTIETISDAKRRLLSYAATAEQFLKAWKFGDWNTFKIRCQGELPHLTTWINGTKVAEMNVATIEWPGFDKQATIAQLGRRGRISLEVHSNGPDDRLGNNRWGPGAVCRWRNIFIKEL
jgi:hypothetical protein